MIPKHRSAVLALDVASPSQKLDGNQECDHCIAQTPGINPLPSASLACTRSHVEHRNHGHIVTVQGHDAACF